MRTHLDATADDMINLAGHETLQEFARLLIRIIKANDYEADHGRGALMDWSDPFNKKLLAAGAFKKRYPDQSGEGSEEGDGVSYSAASVAASSIASSRENEPGTM
ncbi:hypothetical protein [Rhizobium flavescens]|uniref:hypothetical protein n=1 Tax=Rhizobium flavescens TaxID=2607407 RepID=UPI00140DB7BE|nr:hypothetical protein [Rhizobium flavescens]